MLCFWNGWEVHSIFRFILVHAYSVDSLKVTLNIYLYTPTLLLIFFCICKYVFCVGCICVLCICVFHAYIGYVFVYILHYKHTWLKCYFQSRAIQAYGVFEFPFATCKCGIRSTFCLCYVEYCYLFVFHKYYPVWE